MGEVVYMDVCCLKRAFDDQRSQRVQRETAAIAALIGHAERRRLATSIWLEAARVEVPFTERAAARGRELFALGFGKLDALHAAFAEAAGARWLVTTDDRLVALGQRQRAALSTEIANPIPVFELLEKSGT